MKKSFKTAFSLVEISIILLLVGIITTAIVKGNRMFRQSKLTTARILTQNSPVNDIANLVMWYETSLESSFNDLEREDGTQVSVWYDRNTKSENKINATQSVNANRPVFYENVFNKGIPALRFDGTNDFLHIDLKNIINRSYAVFVVEQRRAGGNNELPFLTAGTDSNNRYFFVGYGADTKIIHAQNDHCTSGSSCHYLDNVPAYTSPIPRIHTFWFNQVNGKKYWMNGGDAPDASDADNSASIDSLYDAVIGRFVRNGNTRYFNGDIAEIIIFAGDSQLQTQDRKSVELYLSKKYDIKLE